MPYEISADDDNQIVIARVFGRATRDDHHAAREAIARVCAEKQFWRALVNLQDLQTEGVVTTAGAFDFGKEVADDVRLKGVRMAHVLPRNDDSRNDVTFAVTVAANRGGVIGKFNTIKEARKWLLRDNREINVHKKHLKRAIR
ncbi:MAG: hypothetical protein JW709_03310 [Sedimentisphaerales bacterium]|nr:hypothetical protein [Sedimentisphaerales bacterium]